MTEDMMTGIAAVLRRLGYANVHTDAGYVYYTEADGTEHYLIEHDVGEGNIPACNARA